MAAKQKTKPSKPRDNFPLTAHPCGQWCKKIKGKQYYFGPWHDAAAAETRYLKEAAGLHAGTGRAAGIETGSNALTVVDMCNQYIAAMQMMVDQKRRSPRTLGSIVVSCKKLVEHFGRSKLAAAHTPAVRGQLWLGINCGFGNRDCGTLKVDAIDFDAGTVSHARSKTGVDRDNLPLWPETLAALREAIDARPEPKHPQHADHVFLTKQRLPWARNNYSGPMMQEFAKLRTRAGLDQNDRRKTFYCLRHTFETIACQTGHQVAVNYIMGHVDDSMSGNYRAYQANEPLRLVSNFVRAWLLGLDVNPDHVPAVSYTSASPVLRLADARR